MDTLQWLNNNDTSQKIRNEILSSIAHKKWLREGLSSFGQDKRMQETYEKQLKNKPYLGLRADQLGFGKAILNQTANTPKI